MKGNKVFGSFTVISTDSPDAKKVRRENKVGFQNNNDNHPKIQREIENDIISAFYEGLKKGGQAAATKAVEKKVKYGAVKAVASAADEATLNVAKKTYQRTASRRAAIVGAQTFKRQAAGGFALGMNAVKVGKSSNPIMFVTLVGEMGGGFVGEKIGNLIGGDDGGDIGNELGSLAGAMAAGAALGSVVPGAGTAAGALAGAVSYGIGKAIEGFFSLW